MDDKIQPVLWQNPSCGKEKLILSLSLTYTPTHFNNKDLLMFSINKNLLIESCIIRKFDFKKPLQQTSLQRHYFFNK